MRSRSRRRNENTRNVTRATLRRNDESYLRGDREPTHPVEKVEARPKSRRHSTKEKHPSPLSPSILSCPGYLNGAGEPSEPSSRTLTLCARRTTHTHTHIYQRNHARWNSSRLPLMPPSALFVSQCHHFSPVIYFIAIPVSLSLFLSVALAIALARATTFPPLLTPSLFPGPLVSRSLAFLPLAPRPPRRAHKHHLTFETLRCITLQRRNTIPLSVLCPPPPLSGDFITYFYLCF